MTLYQLRKSALFNVINRLVWIHLDLLYLKVAGKLLVYILGTHLKVFVLLNSEFNQKNKEILKHQAQSSLKLVLILYIQPIGVIIKYTAILSI
jgi:hypothetical protein